MKSTAEGHRLKSTAEIIAECENTGLDFEKPIWLYCFKGARTSTTYVALRHAGFTNIFIYFDYWNEWSRNF
jgi:thiosulfate/3-mercaptopyruvate sulfurtransferase